VTAQRHHSGYIVSDSPERTSIVRSGLRFFGFKIPEGVRDGEALELPQGAHLIALTRGDESTLAGADTGFEEGDEVVLIVEEGELDELGEPAAPSGAGS